MPIIASIVERLTAIERHTEQLQRELYGQYGQDGMRTELKLLTAEVDLQRREAAESAGDIIAQIKALSGTLARLDEARVPRWLCVSAITIGVACAVVIAAATIASVGMR